MSAPQPIAIEVDADQRVSGIALSPPKARAAVVLGHGAGAGMAHPFMAALAGGLAERGIATLRYQFAYMERGSKRPDAPKLAHAVVRAAVAAAAVRWPGLRLAAGGKSFGGRMTSQAEALAHLPGVAGIVFFGFPLHPADKPGIERAEHLDRVALPMLFLQGTRDELAERALLQGVVERLQPRATLRLFDGADHSFHVRARSGRNDAAVMSELLDGATAWITATMD